MSARDGPRKRRTRSSSRCGRSNERMICLACSPGFWCGHHHSDAAGPGVGSGAARFKVGITLLSSWARVPIALEETLRHLALEFIREPPAGANEEAGDVAIGLLLMRLKNRVQYAPQQAGLVGDSLASAGGFFAEARDEIPVICRVAHLPSPSVS